MKKKLILLLMALTTPFLIASTSYNYSHYGEVLHSSPGMNYVTHFSQHTLKANISSPKDLKVYNDKIYIIGTNTESNDNTDIILEVNSDYELVNSYTEFPLTSSYKEKLEPKIKEALPKIGEVYKEKFNNKSFYHGMELPVDKVDSVLNVAELEWKFSDNNAIKNGVANNISGTNIDVEIELTITLSGFSETFNMTTTILTYEDSVDYAGDNIYNISWPTISLESLERALQTTFSGNYSNVEEFFRANAVKNDKNEYTFTENGYKFTGSFDEFDQISGDIVVEYIEETEEESKVEINIPPSILKDIYTAQGAQGIALHESGVYIADTGNNRILKLNHDFEVVDAFFEIEEETFKEVMFSPKKLTIDASERMYVVANNIYEGILELDSDGSFNRYTGVNPIKLTPFEILKRSLMTEEQLANLQLYLPTEYTNVLINEKGFIYATAKPIENNAEDMIQLINPKGIDVLKKNGYHPPMGDIMYIEGMNNYVIDGPSELIDVAATDHGIYTVLDNKRSRLFTYDSEGNLLYVNGAKGTQSDKFSSGQAIDYFGDDLLVLDENGTVVVYRLTEFGELVNKAVGLHDIGKFEEASEVWKKVLKLNTNYEIAYNGIGKYHLREGNFKEAMKNFKRGHDKYYYSKAYKGYRNDKIKRNFSKIVIGILVVGTGIFVYRRRDKFFKNRGNN